MPYLRFYYIFVSHPWTRTSEYDRLITLLNRTPNFQWHNYSVPRSSPLDTRTNRELEKALHDQIRPTHIILILSGMYVNHRQWIQKEIDIANYYKKPIVGIVPWGQTVTPQIVRNAAREMVGWNTNSIIEAIRRHAL